MSSMVQDAYDMGLTTSLGGMPKSSLYYDDYSSYDDENDYEDYDDEDIEESDDVKIIFEVGDIVKLNSNNDITMTIHDTHDDIIVCRWFDKNHILQSAEFNQLELNIIQKKLKLNQEHNDSSNNIPEINIDEDEIPF